MSEVGGVDPARVNFFISYTAADQDVAEWIAWQLEDAGGYTVRIQAWDSRPGNDFIVWMDQAVREAERILVVLSPAYEQATSFTVPEWTAALGRDPSGRLGVLLPVRVVDFTPGGLFSTRGWIDLAGKDKDAARATLLAGIRAARAKPAVEPGYPARLTPPPTIKAPGPVVAASVVQATTDSADLEISLRWRRQVEDFDVTLQYTNPHNNDDIRTPVEQPLHLDLHQLATLTSDETAYGRVLSDSLFELEGIREAFAEARTAAEQHAMAMRLLLLIDSKTPARFHALRWETLRDPHNGRPIATMRNILFSRYLSGTGWRPIPARPGHKLSALVVVANPKNLDQYAPGGRPLTAIDVEGELQRARTALDRYRVTALPSPGASLEGITAELDQDRHDILYLVCHSAFLQGESVLYLEGPDGLVAGTTGAVLVERLGELVQRPTLIVLGVSHVAMIGGEASSHDGRALAPLGLRLAKIGVAAVVGMQGSVTIRTVTDLMPVFFRELQRDGRVDRAMAVARSAIRDRPDWWSPVLYVRLRSGRIWHPAASESGLSEDDVQSHAFTTGDKVPGSTAAG